MHQLIRFRHNALEIFKTWPGKKTEKLNLGDEFRALFNVAQDGTLHARSASGVQHVPPEQMTLQPLRRWLSASGQAEAAKVNRSSTQWNAVKNIKNHQNNSRHIQAFKPV